jgi:hypothetical protein
MKKSIVLGAALLLAGATAFAADLSFGGSFKAGYTFQYNTDAEEWKNTYKTDGDNHAEGELDLSVADADGLWTLEFGMDATEDDTNGGYGDFYEFAKVKVSVNKALETAGIDLGDLKLNASIGNQNEESLLTAYGDYSGRHYQRVFAVSTTKSNASSLTQLTGGYGKYADFQYAFDPTGKSTQAVAVVGKPVDGVKVGGAFATHSYGKRVFTDEFNWAANASFDVDVNKFIQVDKLALNAGAFWILENYDETGSDDTDTANAIGAGVKVGYDKFTLGVDYMFEQGEDNKDDKNHLMAKLTAKDLVKGLTVAPWFRDDDFDTDGYLLGVETSYSFAKLTYCFDVEASLDNENESKDYVKFMPYVKFSF